jgi:hypothetical protein
MSLLRTVILALLLAVGVTLFFWLMDMRLNPSAIGVVAGMSLLAAFVIRGWCERRQGVSDEGVQPAKRKKSHKRPKGV